MTVEGGQDRVLVLAPRGRDAELTCQVLVKAGYPAVGLHDAEQLIPALREGAACAIITQEALAPSTVRGLAVELAGQPPWSDFPLIVLTGHSHALPADLGNVTVLERPVSPTTLLAAVRSAVRARQRQYEGRAAIQQRDQFLAMLGHELRNPLGAIVLASDPGQQRAPDKMAAHLELIARQANHLTRLVDDLLDVARVTSGKVRLHREAVDTAALIDSCVASLVDRARSRGIEVVAAAARATIEADPVRLEQIVNNLVTNAIKYSPTGTTVRVTTMVRDGVWELRIRDQGIGIAPEMLPRVFELFAQAESSLARAEGGMGIGLTLVDRLVRLHDGTVRVVSAGAGQGSEFIVTLPVGAPRELCAAPETPASGAAVSVVLVEDNDDLRELSVSMLETLGCRVEAAADGNAGLALILGSRPALAIVDIGLPGLDGFAIAQQVRRALGDSLVMVAVTGYGQRYDRERALVAGFDAHIAKPLRAAMIQTMIERARALRTAAGGDQAVVLDVPGRVELGR
jgi:signal transduction histidine kinase/ActR/RegA family two-component response regulator